VTVFRKRNTLATVKIKTRMLRRKKIRGTIIFLK